MNIMLTIGIIATLAAVLMTAAMQQSVSAKKPNEKFTEDCKGPGGSSKAGPCPGGSGKSGPHDEVITNPGGNQPPGLQEEED
jgi:hypothetical protein